MIINLRDFYLPLLFISVLLGFQVAFYFLYQFNKVRKEKLELNKNLLAYSAIFGIGLTGYLIRIINLYFIKDINLDLFNFLTKITFLFLFLSLMSYLLLTSFKSFKGIINIRLNKILASYLIIPIILNFIFETNSIIFMLITLITLATIFIYVLILQFKLIRFSTGDVKRRLHKILFGFFLCIIQLFIGGYMPSYILLEDYSPYLQLLASSIFISGLMIVVLGLYKFPAFLELDWKDNILQLFIIDKRNYKLVYKFDFGKIQSDQGELINEASKIEKTDTLVSRGIFGIDEIISTITKTDKQTIEKIQQGDFLILLEYGTQPITFVIFCLLIKKDTNSSRYILRTIKDKFQLLYKSILLNIEAIGGIQQEIFISFDKIMKQLIK